MTLIVASLFLPYQPEFQLNNELENKTADLIESNLVKVNNPQQIDSMNRSKRSSSVHSTTPYVHNLNNNKSDSSLIEKSPFDNSTIVSNNENDEKDIISSEKFLENLTTNATSAVSNGTLPTITSNNLNGSESIEDFFTNVSSDDQKSTGGDEDNDDSIPDHGTNNDNSSTPFTLHAVFDGKSSFVGINNKSHGNKTVVRPKSRAVPDFTAAVVDIDRIKQRQQEFHGAPSMKRVHAHPKPKSIAELSDNNESETESINTNVSISSESEDDEYDSDLETNSSQKYVVPKFGGYSTEIKAKGSRLRTSQELFGKLPWSIVPSEKGNGALKNSINIATKEKTISDKVSWVGTVGIPTDEIPKEISAKITDTLQKDFNSYAVISDDITFKGAYKNFCKQILWPTLHYQIPDNPNSKAFEDHSWNYYQHLNKLFADKITRMYKDGDTIWIQDYHLMLVPEMVREKLPHAKIGFFLHVSFPSSEVFRCFAHREKILKGILGANSVGFQTTEYARHFLQTTNRLLMADVANDEIKYNGKIVSILSTPLGIDAFSLVDRLKKDKVRKWRRLIRERWAGKKLIICRDQFDRIRGINKKLLAYERFLRENPQYIDKIVLIQICLGKPQRDDTERQIMLTVDRINSLSKKSINTSPPVVFLHQELDFAQYLALNSEADLFIVSSLREGLNLTCHEFIVSSQEKNAPLLLSEFTGSVSVLGKGSILINPWDIKHMATSIKRGLEMPYAERRKHWKILMKSVIKNDSDNWILSSLQDINLSWETSRERSTVFNLAQDVLYNDYKAAKKHLFIFKISEPPTARTITVLNELSANNIVFVMNSHSKITLERLYARVLNIGLIAENGAYVRIDNIWYNIVKQVDWIQDVMKIFDDKIERLPGSYYKIAESMIRFHTENAEDQDRVANVIGEAITHINTLFDDKNIHAYIHKDIVFVQQTDLSLSAFKFLLNFYNTSTVDSNGITSAENNSQHPIEFKCITGSSSPVIEPLFKYIKEAVSNHTLKYGHSIVYGDTTSTNAKEHVSGLNELLSILQDLPEEQ